MNKLGTFDPNTNIAFLAFVLSIAVAAATWLPSVLKLFALYPFGWVVSRLFFIVMSLIKHRAEKDAIGDWNGRYFAFEGQQIRIHWDDETTWLVAKDIFDAIQRDPDAVERKKIRVRVGEAHYRDLPGVNEDCFSEYGVLKYFSSQREEDIRKLRRWLEREVFASVRKFREFGDERHERFKIERPAG